ncbi:PD-(D/E)XK nuclease family protein [Paenibacillus sp. TRM 82003]|uniref:RecB family exonuclease n=1 Tax=Kineococcus sp. TRM81007 TaxID=2925831 RepID=UPI001F596286|nr:PD-(D/E)XK nuclease family protein [Kineococcus sp. TRM81007]MCI2237701.1 PD-(D/E)XK nuclease family protein [Kineococcus sp. TRM81007]MCI3921719.1 PD-(D/E)XK nuclease family protein [Paenibacillus sp. TRM 82003]
MSSTTTDVPGSPERPGEPVADGGPPPGTAAGTAAGRARGLSPSRAADFLRCPLLYRFRTIDRLEEAPSPAAARGTLVHAVLERLFDLPAAERTPEAACGMVEERWRELLAGDERLGALFGDDEDGRAALQRWLAQARSLLRRYFDLEDPTRLEPAGREVRVEVPLEGGPVLRGVVDRLDVAPDGRLRVVDYKTGRAPSDRFAAAALFQIRFYALVLWRLRGVVPRSLRLVYLGSGEVLGHCPDEDDLRATEREVRAVWEAIERNRASGEWPATPGRLCSWCDHKALCPAFGGTPPPLPGGDVAQDPPRGA